MAESLGNRLPDELVQALGDEALVAPDQPAFLLITTDPDGAPRICMLSVGELFVRDERTLRVALWRGTRTARNLGRGGTVLLGAVSPGSVIYVRATPRHLTLPEPTGPDCFELTVTGVESDVHVGMPVTSGIMFRPDEPDRATTLTAWRRQREILARAAAPADPAGEPAALRDPAAPGEPAAPGDGR
ncbi:hypothetical protein GCM10023195_63910 [Actinoallomurus liliacearum]|uniref:Pyridoxamine 5'-phosphate oxidase putative domain-containing protein n=1 Tax=Actinoallomurus liliacearum TaxID=1080073 RepID=A0ABP8TUS2_9ACTN